MELPIQTYNTKGNWKELDLIKRARNEAKREGIVIREENIENVNREQLNAVSRALDRHKKVNDREIWIYARRPVFECENDVRKFIAYDREGVWRDSRLRSDLPRRPGDRIFGQHSAVG